MEPLLAPERAVDAIIAADVSADTEFSWPNGSALRTTYERAMIFEQTQDVRIRMPPVPSVNGFINGGLNTRPVFFGCNTTDTPIVIYVPNYPWSYASNVSTVRSLVPLSPESESQTMTVLTTAVPARLRERRGPRCC